MTNKIMLYFCCDHRPILIFPACCEFHTYFNIDITISTGYEMKGMEQTQT